MKNTEILEKMIMLRNKREDEIHKDMEETDTLDTIINDIRHLGKVEFKEEQDGQEIINEKEIFLLIEEHDGNVLYKYYDEDMQLVAVENDVINSELIASIKFKDKDVSFLDQIAQMDKEGKSLSQIEEDVKNLEKIALALGISPEEIEDIDILDLEQQIEENEQEELENKSKEISKEQVGSLDIKETTNLSENIKGQTLGKKLGVDNIKLPNGERLTDGVKLARVSTNSLNKYSKNNISMEDSFVIIRSNGDAVPLGTDILEPDTRSGKNSTSNELTVNIDGTVDRENNTSSYKIVNGNGREFIKVGYDEVSGREIKYSQWSDEKGEYVNTELKTNRDTFMNDDTRQYLIQKNQGTREATETLEKSEHHEECEQDVTLIDDNPNNDSHIHVDENDYIPNTNTTWREFANQCGYRGKGSIERAQERFEKEIYENKDLNNEEIIEEIIEKENEDFRGIQERNQ